MRGASTSSRASSSPPPATPRQSSSAASACAESPFAISAAALEKLVSSRDLDALHERGGVTGLAKGLRSDLSRGLHDDGGEVFEARRRLYGTNRLPDRKTRGIFQLMLAALNDKVLILLSVVAVVSLALGLYQSVALPHGPDRPRVEWVDGVTIMAAVVIVVVAGALNDYQKERQFARLNKKKEDRKVRVIRSGETRQVSVFDILVGDILKLEPGDLVPADAILVTGHGGVRADESSMTGESEQVPKQPADEALANKSCGSEQLDPFIVSGSKIVSGVGDCLVTAVGPNSTYGRLKLSIGERTEAATPLQVKLSAVADKVAFAGAAVAVLLFVVLSVKFFAQLPRNSDPPSEKAQAFLRIFMVSITIVVIAVPEGLPLAVTLALAIAVSRMLRDNNLVRILSACETMANATSVCSDKTGTLTTNKMSVTTGIVGPDGRFSLPDNEDNNKSGAPNHGQPSSDPSSQSAARDAAIGTDDSVDDTVASLPQDVRHLLLESIAVNSAAFEGEDEGQPAYIGSRTEAAILDFAKRHLNMGPLRSARPAADQVADLFPFSSERKFMATVVKKGDKYRMFVKGAPEILLERSQRILQDASSSPFQTVEVSETHEKTLQGVIQEYSGRSLRTLGFAYRDFDEWPLRSMGHDHDGEDKAVVHGASDTIFFHLVFLGIFGLRDPPRPGVRDAVALCQRAGVRVRMVTGDNVDTAKAIAREVGILTDEGIAMEGRQFRELPRERLAKVLARLQVLARASPEDKKALVRMLKQQGEIVAATGDGTNDGPALRAADVGFSMGMAGTEVAREASSIVLMDDNFASIVKAIQWGRSVNDVIRRFLHFQLTVNITAVTLTFVTAIGSETEESVLTPAQLLWVNLIMDTFAALALATDPASEAVLHRKPEGAGASLVSATGWKMILGQAVYQLGVILALNFAGARFLGLPEQEGDRTLQTLVFNTFVWMQVFNLLNNRRLDNKLNVLEGVQQNPSFIAINMLIITGQVLMVLFGGNALSTTPLSATLWAISLALGFGSLPIGMLIRLLPLESLAASLAVRVRKGNKSWAAAHEHDPSARSRWHRALGCVRAELLLRNSHHRQPRSVRLKSIIDEAIVPRVRQRVPGHADEEAPPAGAADAEHHERTPLLGGGTGRSGSRLSSSSSINAPAVVAGYVAGSVARWPSPQPSRSEER